MSLTLATVADALIEFILSLLRDPDVAAEFDDDPEQALISRGLNHASASDVAAVAPIIIERTHVVQVAAAPRRIESESHSHPVIREIKQLVSNVQWVVDDRDTIVDQSVNQNIWAEGDVTQTFDNDAIVASGDEAVAAGQDAVIDKTLDQSTTINAGEDVNIGNDTDVALVEDSFNEDTDASSTTDGSTEVITEDSYNDGSTDVSADDSYNDTTTVTETSEATVEQQVVAETVVVEAPAPTEAPAPAPAPEEAAYAAEEPLPAYDSAAEYTETAVETDSGAEFDSGDSLSGAEVQADDNF